MAEDQGPQIQWVPPRETIQVHLPDGRVLEGKRGSLLGSFMGMIEDEKAPIVGGILNGELRELSYPVEKDATVKPVTMATADGMRIYRRSLTFLLAAAFEEMFPDARLTVDHSVSSGGYYCQLSHHSPLKPKELKQIEARMRQWVDADEPILKCQIPIEQARKHYRDKGYPDKARLLEHRKKPHLVVYKLGDFQDYHHGYMVPSAGFLRWFGLVPTGDGFTLRFPRRREPMKLLPLPDYPKLLGTFRQYGDWLETLGVASVGALNDAIVAGRAREIILVSDALHEQHIAQIAAKIADVHQSARVVLVAGPSSSGKTTFSKRLSIQLLALGLSPYPIALDHFFVDRVNTPKDEQGEYDYESLEALDRERLNHDLGRLIAGERVRLPEYDFLSGQQIEGEEVKLSTDQIVILEGIHGLNPELLSQMPAASTFRIYVSAMTQLNLDRYNRVSTTDTRLIRRIVRDAARRGYSARETIRRWESVRRGEKRYIFPYQENANVMFNSALLYEGSALAPLAEPLIRQVPHGTPEHVEAKRLLAFLEWFLPIDTDLIPDDSILREFIGGSILHEFTPWQKA
ncbi:MAG TPA: nucleoside kinase [Anaerolineae bacterium]|nr:nucleoside kinase [Anaerolineae bacterium]